MLAVGSMLANNILQEVDVCHVRHYYSSLAPAKSWQPHGYCTWSPSESSGMDSNPGRGHCIVFLGIKDTILSRCLSILVYKWVPANLMLGATLACHPGRLYGITPLLVTSSCTESGINVCLMGHLACICILKLYRTDNLTLCQHSPLCVPMIKKYSPEQENNVKLQELKVQIIFVSTQNHLKSCQFLKIPCVHPECGMRVTKADLAEHLERDCKFRLENCIFCKRQISLNKMKVGWKESRQQQCLTW